MENKIIIDDDISTDNTYAIPEKCQRRNSFIIRYRHHKHPGEVVTRRALVQISGTVINIQDADLECDQGMQPTPSTYH